MRSLAKNAIKDPERLEEVETIARALNPSTLFVKEPEYARREFDHLVANSLTKQQPQ